MMGDSLGPQPTNQQPQPPLPQPQVFTQEIPQPPPNNSKWIILIVGSIIVILVIVLPLLFQTTTKQSLPALFELFSKTTSRKSKPTSSLPPNANPSPAPTARITTSAPSPSQTPTATITQSLPAPTKSIVKPSLDKTYSNQKLGFSLKYPSSWNNPYERVSSEQTIVKFSKYGDSIETINEPFLQVHAYESIKPEDKEVVKTTLTKNLQSIKEETILLGGQNTSAISGYANDLNGRKFYMRVVTITYNNKFYVLTWFDEGSNKNTPILNSLLSSFQFIN